MTRNATEKRRHTRIFFGDRERVSGIMSTTGDLEASFPGKILNLSQGGLQFNQKKNEYRGLQPGDSILLRRIIGINELVSLADLPAKVIWVMNNDYLDHVVLGVAFTELSDTQLKTLKSFVSTCLAIHEEEKNT
jgi:hypothetical protein